MMSNNLSQDKSIEKTVTIRVDRNVADQFKKIAKDNNRSQATLIRDFMIDYVEKNQQDK
jgi:predicted transcriptional regulator